MPFIRIVSSDSVDRLNVIADEVKRLGSVIGYNDPRRIWVEVSDKLTQNGVVLALVSAEDKDVNHPRFQDFCDQIAVLLRAGLHKSAEVVRVPMYATSWAPTPEGEKIYAD